MQNIRPSRVCEPRAFAFYTGMNAAARLPFMRKARPAVPRGAPEKAGAVHTRPFAVGEEMPFPAAKVSSGFF